MESRRKYKYGYGPRPFWPSTVNYTFSAASRVIVNWEVHPFFLLRSGLLTHSLGHSLLLSLIVSLFLFKLSSLELSWFLSFHTSMAPVLARRPLHQDIIHALQDAAKKRHRDTQIRKEEQKWKVDSIGYQAMRDRLNQTSFIPPLDADNTRANIYYIKKKFMR
jgi:hypothetical protein